MTQPSGESAPPPSPRPRRSLITWIVLLIVWTLGLISWTAYIVVLIYLAYRIM